MIAGWMVLLVWKLGMSTTYDAIQEARFAELNDFYLTPALRTALSVYKLRRYRS